MDEPNPSLLCPCDDSCPEWVMLEEDETYEDYREERVRRARRQFLHNWHLVTSSDLNGSHGEATNEDDHLLHYMLIFYVFIFYLLSNLVGIVCFPISFIFLYVRLYLGMVVSDLLHPQLRIPLHLYFSCCNQWYACVVLIQSALNGYNGEWTGSDDMNSQQERHYNNRSARRRMFNQNGRVGADPNMNRHRPLRS